MDRTSNIEREILIPLELCMKIIQLPQEEKPTDPADQNLFQEAVTAQVHRYGIFQVKRYRQRLLNEWRYVQTLL
jgi:hypothetical protein